MRCLRAAKGKTYRQKVKDGLLSMGIQMFASRPMRSIKAVFPWGLGGEASKEQIAFCTTPASWVHKELLRLSGKPRSIFKTLSGCKQGI